MNKFKAYKQTARSWETDVVHHVKNQRNTAYIGLVMLALISVGLTFAIVVLTPLKSVEPVVIEVERSTGNINLKTNLVDQVENMTAKEAVIKSLIAEYITAWHTYEYTDNDVRYNFIRALSSREVFKQYENIWRSDDPNINPNLMYKERDVARVKIQSIVGLNDTTYQTRFVVEVTPYRSNSIIEKNFVAITKHKLATGGMSEKDRWVNPIGLLFESVRFDEEYIN